MRFDRHSTMALLAATLLGGGLMAGPLSAAVVFSNGITGTWSEEYDTDGVDFPGFPVSNSDLLEGLMPDETLSDLGPSPGAESTNPNPIVLTDGEFGEYHTGGARPYIFTTSSDNTGYTTLYYILDAVPGGYDITAIDTFTSMTRGSGRDRQDYIVSYATVADPGGDDFTQFAEVHAPYHPGTQHMHLSIDNLSDVTALRFEFPDQIAGYVGYREIDVMGAPVPEPSGLAMLGLTALGWVIGRRTRSTKARA